MDYAKQHQHILDYRNIPFVMNAIYHSYASRFLIVKPFTILKRYTVHRPVPYVATDLLKHLGTAIS